MLPHSSIVIEIRELAGELRIRAVDGDDGEVLAVKDVKVGSTSLSFTLITPSTNWTVHKEIEPRENGALRCTTTTVDDWEKID